MDLNTLIIEDIGEGYTMLNMSYIKIMVLFTILLILMLVWSYKDKDWWETFKTPFIKVLSSFVIDLLDKTSFVCRSIICSV